MITAIMVFVISLLSTVVYAQTLEERLKALEVSIAKQEEVIQELKATQETVRKQEQTINEQRKLIEEMKEEIKQGRTAASPESATAGQTAPTEPVQQQVEELKEKVDKVAEAQTRTFPSVFNPAIGVVGETIFGYRSGTMSETGSGRPGGYDINQRSMELNIAASVDPFAKAYAVINASADWPSGEANLGVEEAALQTETLPWNLTLKAGRFFGEFGRLAYIHDHELPFVNRPLALDQYIGGESRTDGAQLNWLVPTDQYISVTTGLGTQFGGDNPPNNPGEFRNFSGLNFWGRISTYFDLTPDISLEPGISGLWNPHTASQWDAANLPDNPLPTLLNGNIYTERERRLLGADLVLSYKPLRNNQFKSVTWGTELLYSDNRYDITNAGSAIPGGSVGSLGLYSYLAYKFHRQWTAGFLFDWVEDAINKKAQTFAYSPYITWVTSHWNQIRLQYTYTDHNAESTAAFGLRSDNAVYLQWAWIIGAHSHGWQQR
jgi:uncharacterized coiled-coil protein SlyX